MTTGVKKITALKFSVKIIVEKDEPGFHAYAPSLKGLHIGGDTVAEALDNAREAAGLFLKSMIKNGDPIPIDILEPEKQRKIIIRDGVFSSLEEIRVNLE